MFGKNFVPEIWAKMLSANQIAVFLNEKFIFNFFSVIFYMLIPIQKN